MLTSPIIKTFLLTYAPIASEIVNTNRTIRKAINESHLKLPHYSWMLFFI
jgi:hypothetical protein